LRSNVNRAETTLDLLSHYFDLVVSSQIGGDPEGLTASLLDLLSH
jgi:hypothetical protein